VQIVIVVQPLFILNMINKLKIMKKIIIPIVTLLLSSLVYGQNSPSPTENYVQSKTYLEPVTTSSSDARQINTVQYFDGLGRPKQIVNVKASPLGRDIVTPISYDDFGRQTRDYLPVPQLSTSNGAIYSQTPGLVAFPVGDPTNVYVNERAFSEKIIENSPLDRIQQQIQVGTDWSTKPVKFDYEANTNADYVRKYETSTTWVEGRTQTTVQLLQYFLPNQLYKNTVTDEDGNKTIEFKNGKGQTLLVRKALNSTENADTYYVYNEYDQLAFVIPPLASSPTVEPSTMENLYYQYRYDGRNRLVEKKLPGKGWEFMVYDKADRLILTRDSNLETKGQWLMTKYDNYGRVISTAIIKGLSRTEWDSILKNLVIAESRTTAGYTANGMSIFYTNNYFATDVQSILTINYYDTYPSYSFNPSFPGTILNEPLLKDTPDAQGLSTKSLPVMSLVKNIEDDNWTKNYTYYDTRGRAIGSYSINHLGGYTRSYSKLDFSGVPQKTETQHIRKTGEAGIMVKERFVYDQQNRLLQHYHQVDSKPEELLADNSYNELSQLSNKKVGNNLQSIDYAYNIRGWMTGINPGEMSVPDLNGKLFSYKIKYNQKEGISYPTSQFSAKEVKPKYNGNIAEVDWRSVENIGNNPSTTPKRYGYVYDGLNRLTAGYYQNPNNPSSAENLESLAYDLNGNITSLYRTSVLQGTTAMEIDDLDYTYKGNQAIKIKDHSNNKTGYEGVDGGPIMYDLNGNMKMMLDKNIENITYNYLNLPNKLNLTIYEENKNIVINTLYGADGSKRKKENITNISDFLGNGSSTSEVTDYLDGFQYLTKTYSNSGGGGIEILSRPSETNYALEQQAYRTGSPFDTDTDPTINPPLDPGITPFPEKTPDLQFFPTAEGFYDYKNDQYIYQYKDHLGNVRVSFARNSAGVIELKDNNDYYPFGMNHLKTGTSYYGVGNYQNYKYNGKELQETGMYDYGARFYMADIGRWGVIDPRSEYTHEAYSYVWNNPISFNDPTGMSGELFGYGGPEKKDPPVRTVNIEPVVITIYRPVKLESRGFDFSSTAVLSSIAMTGSRYPNPYTLAVAGLAGIILWNTPKIYQATEAWRKDEMTIDLSPKALPAHFAQGQDLTDEDINGQEVPNESKDSTLYLSKTGKRAVDNRITDISQAEFEKNLQESGYNKTQSPDGKRTTYTKGNKSYTVRKDSKEGSPTADFRNNPNGTGKTDLKIRFKP